MSIDEFLQQGGDSNKGPLHKEIETQAEQLGIGWPVYIREVQKPTSEDEDNDGKQILQVKNNGKIHLIYVNQEEEIDYLTPQDYLSLAKAALTEIDTIFGPDAYIFTNPVSSETLKHQAQALLAISQKTSTVWALDHLYDKGYRFKVEELLVERYNNLIDKIEAYGSGEIELNSLEVLNILIESAFSQTMMYRYNLIDRHDLIVAQLASYFISENDDDFLETTWNKIENLYINFPERPTNKFEAIKILQNKTSETLRVASNGNARALLAIQTLAESKNTHVWVFTKLYQDEAIAGLI